MRGRTEPCESDRQALMDPVPFLETMTGPWFREGSFCVKRRVCVYVCVCVCAIDSFRPHRLIAPLFSMGHYPHIRFYTCTLWSHLLCVALWVCAPGQRLRLEKTRLRQSLASRAMSLFVKCNIQLHLHKAPKKFSRAQGVEKFPGL